MATGPLGDARVVLTNSVTFPIVISLVGKRGSSSVSLVDHEDVKPYLKVFHQVKFLDVFSANISPALATACIYDAWVAIRKTDGATFADNEALQKRHQARDFYASTLHRPEPKSLPIPDTVSVQLSPQFVESALPTLYYSWESSGTQDTTRTQLRVTIGLECSGLIPPRS